MSETIRAKLMGLFSSQRKCFGKARQKIEPSYERCVYARKSNNLFSGSFEIPSLYCQRYFSRLEGGGGGCSPVWCPDRSVSLPWKPVEGAAWPPPPRLPPLGWLKSIILFRSTLVKLHGFIKRGGFIRAELRHSGTMSIKCGSIKCKFLEITVHSCLPTASHPIETLRFCLNGFWF